LPRLRPHPLFSENHLARIGRLAEQSLLLMLRSLLTQNESSVKKVAALHLVTHAGSYPQRKTFILNTLAVCIPASLCSQVLASISLFTLTGASFFVLA